MSLGGCGVCIFLIIGCLWAIPTINYYSNGNEFPCLIVSSKEEQFDIDWYVNANAINQNNNLNVTISELCSNSNKCKEIKEMFYPEGEIIDCAYRAVSALTPNKGYITRADLPMLWSDLVGLILIGIFGFCSICLCVAFCYGVNKVFNME